MIAPEHRAEAMADAKRAADMGSVSRFGKSGRLSMRIPADAFYRAINNNGGVDENGKTCWDDPEYVADMKRHHPHIACTKDGNTVISLTKASGASAPRNRHGKVKERIVYRNGKKVTMKFS